MDNEITVNGVTYVRKEEKRKPKKGDVYQSNGGEGRILFDGEQAWWLPVNEFCYCPYSGFQKEVEDGTITFLGTFAECFKQIK